MFDFQEYLDEVLAEVDFTESNDETKDEYDIVKEVQDLLVSTREYMNISQKVLSDKTGISQANISKIETGRSVPSLPVLKRLADGLGKRLIVGFAEEDEE